MDANKKVSNRCILQYLDAWVMSEWNLNFHLILSMLNEVFQVLQYNSNEVQFQ